MHLRRTNFLIILFISLLFISSFAPLFAIPLPAGRSMDETHNTGYIDWTSSVSYADLYHRDGICPTGCWENVTRISNGSSVSGDFAGEVSYFEVGVACTHYSSTGSAILTACGNSNSINLYLGSGGGSPGFMSFSVPVPSGCNSWSLSAAGGDVHFRSVDVSYSSIPVETDTPIPTEVFTETFTETPIQSETFTETPIQSETFTETPNQSETFTETPISTLTYTSTGSVPINTSTPVPNTWTGNNDNRSTQTNHTYYTKILTPTPDQQVIPFSGKEIEAAIAYLSTDSPSPTPSPTMGTPVPFPVCAPPPASSESGSSDTGFPGWIIPGIGSIAAGFAFLKTLVDKNKSTTLTLNNGGITIKIPHLVKRETTIGDWVSKPIKAWVKITKTIWRTITELVPRFITVTRRIIEYIKRSKWVTTIVRVAKTVYQTIWKKVPLLNWLGIIISFIWKKIIQPVIKWINQTVRKLVTWTEKVIRTFTERIQDGWNKITRRISEIITQWVEQTTWVREFIQKKITVTEIQWETKFIPFPSGGVVSKVLSAFNNPKFKIGTTLLATTVLSSLALSNCDQLLNIAPTATLSPAPKPIQLSYDCFMILQSQTSIAATETAKFSTPTPSATPQPTETMTPAADWLRNIDNPSNMDTHYSNLGFLNNWINDNLWWLQKYGYPTDEVYWQNYFNSYILENAQEYDIPPLLLKGILLKESQTAVNPGSWDASGIAQITIPGSDLVLQNGKDADYFIRTFYNFAKKGESPNNIPDYDEAKYGTYQNYYKSLSKEQQLLLRTEGQKMFDGVCYPADEATHRCSDSEYNPPLLIDSEDSIRFAAQYLYIAKNQLISLIEEPTWNQLSEIDQWKLVAAAYNGGVSCTYNAYINAKQALNKDVLTWDDIKPYTDGNCKTPEDTFKYPDESVCYANGNGDTPCQ
jgi:hypothetical protein